MAHERVQTLRQTENSKERKASFASPSVADITTEQHRAEKVCCVSIPLFQHDRNEAMHNYTNLGRIYYVLVQTLFLFLVTVS